MFVNNSLYTIGLSLVVFFYTASGIREEFPSIDVFINNAGVFNSKVIMMNQDSNSLSV